LSTSVIVF